MLDNTAKSVGDNCDRAPVGQFANGNRGGDPPPNADKLLADARESLLDAFTQENLMQIGTNMVELARGGDAVAIELLFNRKFFSPQEAADLT